MPRLPIRFYEPGARFGRIPAGDLVRTPRVTPGLGPAQTLAIASTLASLGYIYREEIAQVAQELVEVVRGDPEAFPVSAVTKAVKVKRKLSKANKAMKQAMKATKNKFKEATKLASKANPNTKSKIGKGSSRLKKLARKIRKSIWGVTKRFKK